MTTALVPNELNDLGQNENFADLAQQLADKAGEGLVHSPIIIGSPEWIEAGDLPQPWTTGGHFSEGWNHSTVITDPKKRLLVLSNYLSRPRNWPFAGKRDVGYGPGEYPLEHPGPYAQVFNQGTDAENVAVYGMDSEHFLAGQLISLCEAQDKTLVSGLIWGANTLPPLTVDALARMALGQVQRSCTGQMMTWLGNQQNGLAVRPPDRVTARLTWVAIRCIPICGLDGENEVVLRVWLDNLARWISQGPHYQETKVIGTEPQVTLPYYNPVHSYGYLIPVVWWLLQYYGGKIPEWQRTQLQAWMVSATKEIVALVGEDGATPWAIDQLGIHGYMAPPNGDQYTPGYEVYTALRIAATLGVEGAIVRSSAIRTRFEAKEPAIYYRPWLCDANFECVVGA